MNIRIAVGTVELEGTLNESATARKIADILPFSTSFSTWGEEIYFPVPVEAGLDETAREVVELGDLGYWPAGNAFCIFFGQTPMSSPGRIVPASAVNVIGRIPAGVERLKEVMEEGEIRVEPA